MTVIINLRSNSYDGTTILAPSSYDEVGRAVASAGDFDGDGFDDLLVLDRRDQEYYDRGAVVVFTGGPETLTREFAFGGTREYNFFGASLASIGDFNGDGFDDIAASDGGSDEILVDFGRAAGDENSGFRITGGGSEVDSAGDMNADGYDDMLIGTGEGAFVLFGKPGGSGDIDLTNLPAGAGFEIEEASPGDQAGVSVASAGDVNGDGFDDIVIGAPQNDAGGVDAGAAYVLFGKAGGFGTVDLGAIAPGQGFSMRGVAFEQVGRIVASAGDINGDGYDDVAVTGVENRVYVVFGKSGGFGNIKLATLAPGEGFEITHNGSAIGADAIDSAGDIDGDGYDDLLIGRPNEDGRGEAYVIYGRAGGFEGIDLDNLDPNDGFVLRGGLGDNAGVSVAGAGDLNGDGYDDIAIGAPDNSGGDAPETDAVFVIYGGERFAATDFRGGLGDDRAVGGTREDFLSGGAGRDILSGRAADDFLRGGNGDDVLGGGEGDDRLDGGQGVDTASYTSATQAVTIDLSLGAQDTIGAGTDTLISIENVTGSAYADSLAGSSGRNLIEGGGGDDFLEGRGGGDRFEGGDGVDTVSYAWSAVGVRASLNTRALQDTNVGVDRFIGVENLTGSAANDVLGGSAGENLLRGGAGDDRLVGNAGVDRLVGGAGRDDFVFRDGDSGFAVSIADRILDFSRSDGDKINLGLMDAIEQTAANEAFTFIGTAAFSGAAGELRYTVLDGQAVVRADIDGDRIADFTLVVENRTELAAVDFVL